MPEKKKPIIGLIEPVILENTKTYKAKVDTGADSSSIDTELLKSLGEEKEIIAHKMIRSALGRHRRPTVMLEIEFHGKKSKEKFTVSDRKSLKYKILIGKDILKKHGVLIDPNK